MGSKQQKVSSSFFYILSLLWILIILLQWVSYSEPILYKETTAGICAALFITVVTEALVFIKRPFRMIIQLPLVVYAVYWILMKEEMVSPGFLQLLRSDQLLDMLPYFWFALASWAIFLFASVWANNKRRILLVVGLNVVAFGVLDSFTEFILWDETAWIVVAGMAWLVTEHFKRFSRRFPLGWFKLRKNPIKIFGNILVIFSLIILAGVNMPNIQPTLRDPYTAWKDWKGLPLSGGSHGGSTNSILGGQAVSVSGYGRNDNDLGDGFNFDYSPVMTVTSEARNYWRGETRSNYTGTGWDDKNIDSKYLDVEIGESLGDQSLPYKTQTVKQSVTMLNDNVYPVLFGAYSISKVEKLDSDVSGRELRWRDGRSELHLKSEPKRPNYPKTYTVTSEVPIISFEELQQKTSDQLYSGSRDIEDKYLQIPSSFPERVQSLAMEVTAEGKTPYEKVMLLQQYLQTNFDYTNSPDLSRRESSDFVDAFLFEVKEGYCDYFSTSMVMMTRSLGIPARWVKGYAPGRIPANDLVNRSMQNDSDESYRYTVTNADAHSWVEVYFGEYGWIPVETTPGFTMPIMSGTEQQEKDIPEDKEDVKEEYEKPSKDTPAGEKKEQSPVYLILAAIAGIIIIAWIGYILWRNRITLRFSMARLRAGKPLTPADMVIAETERWLRYVRRRGLTRGADETLRESVHRWEESYPSLGLYLTPLLNKFEAARYSPAHILEEEWRSVQLEAKQLKKSMKNIKIS